MTFCVGDGDGLIGGVYIEEYKIDAGVADHDMSCSWMLLSNLLRTAWVLHTRRRGLEYNLRGMYCTWTLGRHKKYTVYK